MKRLVVEHKSRSSIYTSDLSDEIASGLESNDYDVSGSVERVADRSEKTGRLLGTLMNMMYCKGLLTIDEIKLMLEQYQIGIKLDIRESTEDDF